MAGSSFAVPKFTPAEIVAALEDYRISPSTSSASTTVSDIENPRPGFLAEVLQLFLIVYLGYDPNAQVNFQALQTLDNPEHHMHALSLTRIYRRADAFFQAIQFRDLNLRDLLRADRGRVVYILSALINFLVFREERIQLLLPLIQKYGPLEERKQQLRTKLLKTKEDHLLKEQMEAPVVQQLKKEVNAFKQRLLEYNKESQSLRAASKAIGEKKEETLAKLHQADFELVKALQEKEKLLAKIVQSPEKLQRNLEEKKAVRDELKNLEKMAIQKFQEKTNTLEMYTKVSEKLAKHLSKISALHDKGAAAKTSEKEFKAHKEKISDQNLEIKALHNKAADWRLKVLENEAKLKSKEKEREQRVGENNRKMTTLKSEVEAEHKCLEEKQRKIKEKIEKGSELCSQAELVAEAGRKKVDEICDKFSQVIEAANMYMDGVDQSLDETDEAAVMLNTIAQNGA